MIDRGFRYFVGILLMFLGWGIFSGSTYGAVAAVGVLTGLAGLAVLGTTSDRWRSK